MDYCVTQIYLSDEDETLVDDLITRHMGQIRAGHPITVIRGSVKCVVSDAFHYSATRRPGPAVADRFVAVEYPCRRCAVPTRRRVNLPFAGATNQHGTLIVAECEDCARYHPCGTADRRDARPWDEGR